MVKFQIGAEVDLHDMLHGLREVIGKGNACLKSKMLHQIMEMREEVLYEVLLELRKVYNALEQERCMDTLVGYALDRRQRDSYNYTRTTF